MTAECIESVFCKTHGVEFEIILVDNGSTDGSKEYFEKESRITYVYSKENLGFGKANNLGLKYATGKYIFLLNSDTLLVNNAVFEMFSFMEMSEPMIGFCGGLLQNKDGTPRVGYYKNLPTLNWIFQEIIHFAIPALRFLVNPYAKTQKAVLKDKYPLFVDFICGADLFVKREVVDKCGFFDPDFFMYYEETEMEYRFHKNGYKSVIIDSSKIIHLCGASSPKNFNLKKFNIVLQSRYLYAKKVFSPFNQMIFRLIHLILLPRILICFSPWKEKKETLKIIFG